MNKRHEELLEAAKEAASKLFGDTGVARAQTRESLMDLVSHCQDMLDTLREQERQTGE